MPSDRAKHVYPNVLVEISHHDWGGGTSRFQHDWLSLVVRRRKQAIQLAMGVSIGLLADLNISVDGHKLVLSPDHPHFASLSGLLRGAVAAKEPRPLLDYLIEAELSDLLTERCRLFAKLLTDPLIRAQ